MGKRGKTAIPLAPTSVTHAVVPAVGALPQDVVVRVTVTYRDDGREVREQHEAAQEEGEEAMRENAHDLAPRVKSGHTRRFHKSVYNACISLAQANFACARVFLT